MLARVDLAPSPSTHNPSLVRVAPLGGFVSCPGGCALGTASQPDRRVTGRATGQNMMMKLLLLVATVAVYAAPPLEKRLQLLEQKIKLHQLEKRVEKMEAQRRGVQEENFLDTAKDRWHREAKTVVCKHIPTGCGHLAGLVAKVGFNPQWCDFISSSSDGAAGMAVTACKEKMPYAASSLS